jgi:UDP-3-O-acyl-N-acetylglucosamine deacetylase
MTICPVGAHWFSAHTTYSNSLAQDFSFEKGGVIIDRSDRMNGDSMIFPDENVLGKFLPITGTLSLNVCLCSGSFTTFTSLDADCK